jgi:hypothetical protein
MLFSKLPYLDPGSGSFILQMIIAGAAGLLFVIRGHISNLFKFGRRNEKRKTKNKKTN